MEWQLTDIQAAFHYLDGVDVVNSKAIGIWGISQGGKLIEYSSGLCFDAGHEHLVV